MMQEQINEIKIAFGTRAFFSHVVDKKTQKRYSRVTRLER